MKVALLLLLALGAAACASVPTPTMNFVYVGCQVYCPGISEPTGYPAEEMSEAKCLAGKREAPSMGCVVEPVYFRK